MRSSLRHRRVRTPGATRLRATRRELLGPGPEHAFRGYLGFLDAACLTWVEADCPDGEREPLVAAAVGALRGALTS